SFPIMSPLLRRNQQQLLLVKQLYEDAASLAARGDSFSLTKGVIFLDLAVEHLLNNIVLNLDPNFTVNETKGSEDIARKTLWGNAVRAARMSQKGGLPETRELANLHALRNLVQHSGTEPAQSEVQRYLAASKAMFTAVFRDIYQLDFPRFQIWDLVANKSLAEWLQDSEYALTKGHPEICIARCNHAHAIIITAIRSFTKLRRFPGSRVFSSSSPSRPSYPSGLPLGAIREIEGMARKVDAEIRGGVDRFRSEIMKEIEFLEDEVVAIGVGLPLMDTRRFQKIGSTVHSFFSGDGQIQVGSAVGVQSSGEAASDAAFMLSYLSRLIRLLDEAYLGVLENVQMPKPPLHEQGIWRAQIDNLSQETLSTGGA
ncbi:MAG: hypothetical protein ACREBG_12375, partial [Pyrinomonadaceae bacterium]